MEVATPASNAVYTPKVNMPEIDVNGGDSKQSNTSANFTFRLGKRTFSAFVGDIYEAQKEIELRERREAGR
ncbi:hypothetical protein ABFG93_00410 [Pseudalkalibacillus hwajinpoensis]|uniref:hypothetical protein n=1 Tax=Guptibacillus hwajinpoensis TaxID=208199 RepID=UPI00325A4F55